MMTPSERLRGLLRDALAPPFAVSERGTQYWFDEDSAGYAEIDVRRGDDFVIVTVVGALDPALENLLGRVWLARAAEVWFVDEAAWEVVRLLKDRTRVTLTIRDLLTTPQLPGVAIPVSTLFETQ
jgi:hypothetical protein